MNWSLCKIYEFSLFLEILTKWIQNVKNFYHFDIFDFFLLIFWNLSHQYRSLYLIHFSCLILYLVSKIFYIFYISGQITWNYLKITQVLRKIKNTVSSKVWKNFNFWSEISEMKKNWSLHSFSLKFVKNKENSNILHKLELILE
jgi:hypothetical protein